MSSPVPLAIGSGLAQLVLALTMAASVPASADAQGAHGASSGGSRPISPAVIAAWSAHTDSSGAAILDFLVLLRGEPGWFMGSGSRVSGGSRHVPAEGGLVSSDLHLTYGIHTVELRFDPAALTLTVQDEVVSLQAVNVVLVDGVGEADGIRVEQVFWVDPRLPDLEPTLIEGLLRAEPAVFPWLRCEARLNDDGAQQMFDAFCARIGPAPSMLPSGQ